MYSLRENYLEEGRLQLEFLELILYIYELVIYHRMSCITAYILRSVNNTTVVIIAAVYKTQMLYKRFYIHHLI